MDLHGQAFALGEDDLRDVVNPRRVDPRDTQQRLERQLDDLLRLPDDVCPTLAVEEDIKGAQPHRGPAYVVAREIWISHQVASTQYGWPCDRRRMSPRARIRRRIRASRREISNSRSKRTMPSVATSAHTPVTRASSSGICTK